MWALIASVLIEAAWTLHLGPTLSSAYRAQHWRTVWVGLDVAEMVMLVATLWSLWRERTIAVVLASATGALFLADAWFDIVTDQHRDLAQSLWLALVWEVPWATVLFYVARRELRRVTSANVTRRN